MLASSLNPLINEQNKKKVDLCNFVLSELLTNSRITEEDILNFKTKEQVFSEESSEVVITIRCRTEMGDTEIRVTKPSTVDIHLYESKKKAQLYTIRLLYESSSRNYIQKTPSFSHSKLLAYQKDFDPSKTLDTDLSKIVIEVEEDLGSEFAYTIMYQIEEYILNASSLSFNDEILLSKLKNSFNTIQDLDKSIKASQEATHMSKKQKGSLISFLWGAILSQYCIKIQKTEIKLALTSPLFSKYVMELEDGKHAYIESTYIKTEQSHYLAIFNQTITLFGADYKLQMRILEVKLKQIFRSEIYRLFREEEVMTYGPKYLDLENLRIFRKSSDMGFEKKDEDIFGMSYNPNAGITKNKRNILNSLNGINFDFGIQGAESSIYGRYRLYNQLDFMLEHELDQFVRQNGTFLKGYETNLAVSMLEGYRSNYKIFKEDEILLTYVYVLPQ